MIPVPTTPQVHTDKVWHVMFACKTFCWTENKPRLWSSKGESWQKRGAHMPTYWVKQGHKIFQQFYSVLPNTATGKKRTKEEKCIWLLYINAWRDEDWPSCPKHSGHPLSANDTQCHAACRAFPSHMDLVLIFCRFYRVRVSCEGNFVYRKKKITTEQRSRENCL